MGFIDWWNDIERSKKPATVYVDPHAAGEFARQLCAVEREFARGDHLGEAVSPPKPSCGDALQDEINELELQLNRAKQKADDLAQEMAPHSRAIASGASATARLFLDAKIRDLTPAFEKAQSEVVELAAKHKELLAKRKLRDKERLQSASCSV
jgi:hypothetical protein